ncbi:IclR family transcriptional regulator [Alkalihalobacillus oceani]|uniref:IclR family transcriptional regulator n=1 Tax=Halalkalibacter oceani TaxID=1653776 RepID=A0A9X2DTU4_9BACI|nr:IclR family transcriptional regulator [Halalkalibacter oceani]MCM3716312.1 IclR family transcriptional regulator [Halalkalibacter oceani]
MTKKTKSLVPSIDKAVDIIILLSQKPNRTLKQIYEELGYPASTCFNIITTLEQRGIVEKNKLTSQFKLGTTLMRLGMQLYEDIDIRKVALPIMKTLVAKFGETSYLTIVDYSTYEGVVIDKIESLKTVTVIRSIGSRVPLYASATGKSLLSGLTNDEIEDYFSKVNFVKYTEKTITSKDQLMEELNDIREMGYAITENDMGDGASAVSAPIKDYQGKVVAAVSLSGPSNRMEEQIPLIIPEVKLAAEKISSLL